MEIERRQSAEYSAAIFNEQPVRQLVRDPNTLRPTPVLERYMAQQDAQHNVAEQVQPQAQEMQPTLVLPNVAVLSRSAREVATGVKKSSSRGRGTGRGNTIPFTGELVFEQTALTQAWKK
ncbi:hypothetical protein AKO1_015432 [Acrasis kona]|uniref:Uncharacterized protein n=1 Tax=Acrasis kona TaxID=1008807 RepID=A0AAW2ZFX3_9EUKA